MPTALESATRTRTRTGHDEFPEGEFVTLRDVPVFAEHETQARDGRRLRFTRYELEAVAQRCNRRISETGDYAAITLGHTADPGHVATGQARQPPVVGFAGPFKVGRIGEPGRARYAILADFHVYAEDYPKLRQHPRRSPELWLEERYEEMFLDPIALLGAEAPRLDMGLLYSARRQGRLIQKYVAVGSATSGFFATHKYAAVASATSGFVPTDRYEAGLPSPGGSPAATGAIGRMTRYGADEDNQSEPGGSPGSGMNMTQEDISALVDALEQLDWVQWVKSEMGKESGVGNSSLAPRHQQPGGQLPGGGLGGPENYAAGDEDLYEYEREAKHHQHQLATNKTPPGPGNVMGDASDSWRRTAPAKRYSRQEAAAEAAKERAFQTAKHLSSIGEHQDGLYERCLREAGCSL